MYKIGIIGNGNQSVRIQKILKKLNKKFYIYKPESTKNYYNYDSFQKLKKCKIIFILSPNKTHFHYIKLLSKSRYIFCEKPPVTNARQLRLLNKYNHGNIYFNFNFRFSTFSEVLKNHKRYNLGKLLSGNIYSCHGLAFKKKYVKNWRSNKKYNPLGVLEMVLIHYIDMINFNLSLSRPTSMDLNNFSKKGTSPDTCNISFKHGNSKIDFFATYSSPFYQKIFLLFENGYIEQKDNSLKIRGPRMILNKKGQFVKPKLIKNININQMNDFDNSLIKSVNFFMNVVFKKEI